MTDDKQHKDPNAVEPSASPQRGRRGPMTGFLSNRPIGLRIAVALLLPVLGLVFFAGAMVLERRAVMAEMAALERLAAVAPDISAVVHELQKERGASAGFIGAKGGAFASPLDAQRRETDAAIGRLRDPLAAFDAKAYGADFVRRLEAQRSRLGELAGVRTKVSDFSMPMGEMAGWYTTTIGGLLDVIGTMGTLSQDADITRSITAYIAFLQAKERAGIERAMGSNGFSAGAFAPAVYQRYVGLIAEQTAFQSLFRAFAAPELISALDGVLAAPAAKEVDRMRAIALESPQTGSTGGVAGADWFKTITAKIDGLKGVEDLTAAALLKQAKAAEANAFQAFLTTLAVVVLLQAATAGLVTIVVRGITRPIAMLTRDMGLLAQGDRTVSIDGVERGDEIGAMSRAVQVFKDAMIANDRLQEELNHHATHDPLTGALNRRAFALLAEKQVAQAARTGRPLAVLMMDLDHFKRINDTLGHSGGDATLCRFVAVAGDVLRAEDVLCRFGGEEFVALLPHAEAAQAVAAAERLRLAFAATGATVSIGVASLRPGEDLEDLLRRADAALYDAKRAGRDRTHLSEEVAAAPAAAAPA